MRDYSLELAQIAAGIVGDVLGGTLTASTVCSADGNSIIMEFDGYPLYNTAGKGKVFVQFPRSTFYVRRGDICFSPLQQAQCRYYQGVLGHPFAHPHVFGSGQPCWDSGKRERVVDFICNIIETFSLQNVTEASVRVGHCASAVMETDMRAVSNARKQQEKVMKQLKCKALLLDRRELEGYVDRRWRNRITIYRKTYLGG